MTKWVWGYLYWGALWLLLGFLAAELLGFFGVAPWPTFSETVWHSLTTYTWLRPLVFATLVFLITHFLYHKPLLISVGFGLVIALAAHMVDKSWP